MSGKRVKKVNRNSKYRPWAPLVPFMVPPEAAMIGVKAAFQNHLLTIFIKETDAPGFADPEGNPSKIAHLDIRWTDPACHDEIPFRFKQKAKNELLGDHAEAVELFPASWRVIPEIKSCYMWGMVNGATFPLGLIPNDIEEAIAKVAGGRENMVMREELEMFVVRHAPADGSSDGIVEVFENEGECISVYGDTPIPDNATSGIELLGSVPVECPTVGWTDAAKVKAANVSAKSQAVQSSPVEIAPELFKEADTVEDEIWDGDDDIDDGPASVEENLALASAMEEAMESVADRRVKNLKAVTESVIGDAERNISDLKKSSKKKIVVVPR